MMAYRWLQLSQGEHALVDNGDFERASKFKWSCGVYRNRDGTVVKYAMRTDYTGPKYRTVFLHRFILEAPKGVQVDHVNRARGLDCRRSNIRLATPSQNGANRGKNRDGRPYTSRYKGVSFWRRCGKWVAEIYVHPNRIFLGAFVSERDAARAYNAAAQKYFGEFARLNRLGKGAG